MVVNISWEQGDSRAFLWICARSFLSISMSVCVPDVIFSSVLSTVLWTCSSDEGSRERAIGPGGEASAGRSEY